MQYKMNQRLKQHNITLVKTKGNFHDAMYFHLYPDLLSDFRSSQGWDHYIKYGENEKRLFPPKSLIDVFDKQRYCKMYPDVLINYTIKTAWLHFINHGLKEDRYLYILGDNSSFMETMMDYIHKNEKPIYYPSTTEKKITILIRTCYRPLLFKRCIESILQQRYSNVHIVICYDNQKAKQYIEPYTSKVKYCDAFFCTIQSDEKYKFNLYCNDLLYKVTSGYCLYLDDDNEFTHENCLNIINHNLREDRICIWKYLRGDKLIYPQNTDSIVLGDIDSSSFCFPCEYKKYGKWPDKQYGDYSFLNSVITKITAIKNTSPKDEITYIPLTLTKCIQENIGNFGKSTIEGL